MKSAPAEPLTGITSVRTVPAIIRKSSELLKAMFDEQRCLFAYSTRMKEGKYVNGFYHPAVYRYTINCFAVIQQAKSFEGIDWDIANRIDNFWSPSWLPATTPSAPASFLYLTLPSIHTSSH